MGCSLTITIYAGLCSTHQSKIRRAEASIEALCSVFIRVIGVLGGVEVLGVFSKIRLLHLRRGKGWHEVEMQMHVGQSQHHHIFFPQGVLAQRDGNLSGASWCLLCFFLLVLPLCVLALWWILFVLLLVLRILVAVPSKLVVFFFLLRVGAALRAFPSNQRPVDFNKSIERCSWGAVSDLNEILTAVVTIGFGLRIVPNKLKILPTIQYITCTMLMRGAASGMKLDAAASILLKDLSLSGFHILAAIWIICNIYINSTRTISLVNEQIRIAVYLLPTAYHRRYVFGMPQRRQQALSNTRHISCSCMLSGNNLNKNSPIRHWTEMCERHS